MFTTLAWSWVRGARVEKLLLLAVVLGLAGSEAGAIGYVIARLFAPIAACFGGVQ